MLSPSDRLTPFLNNWQTHVCILLKQRTRYRQLYSWAEQLFHKIIVHVDISLSSANEQNNFLHISILRY